MIEAGHKRLKVLIVEDEKVISEVCRRTLEKDYEITLTPNGQTAMELINAQAFDLALIDIRTPLMNGEELYNWITKHQPSLLPGIIFTTGDVISHNTENFLTSVNQPYLPKPFSPKELTTIIEKVVSSL
jgi:CheY-like chemotaxis protein